MPPGRTSNGGGCFLPIKFTEGEIFTPSEYIEEGVVPMIFKSTFVYRGYLRSAFRVLYVTYRVCSSVHQTQIKQKR